MTDEQNNHDEKETHSFGDIPIKAAEVFTPKKTARRPRKANHYAPLRAGTSTTTGNRPSTVNTVKKRGVPYLALLCIPLAFFVLYLAAARYLVPVLIKGPLATQLGQRLNRPLSVGKVTLSPFTFRLHLGDVAIGPDPSRKDDPELCRASAVDSHICPTSLLQGKLVLEDVHIKQLNANLVRYRDGTYNILSTRPGRASDKAIHYSKLLPPWLLVQGLYLADGTMIFHDRPVNRQHRIGQIQISLPTADSEKTGADPTLSAVINSSPILVHGQRHSTAEGKTELRLSLQLKAVNPQQYLAYFPAATNYLDVTDGSSDAELNITFQDNKQPAGGLTVTGKATLSDLVLQDKNKTFRLKLSTAHITLRAQPLQRLYTIEELVIDTPQLTLANDQPASLMNTQTKLTSFLKRTGFGLQIKRLQVKNGSLKNDNGTGYHNLQVMLTGFQNQTAAEQDNTSSQPAELSVTATNRDSTITFQGQVNPSLTPTGKISLQDMNTDILPPYLATIDGVRLSKGKIKLAGTLLTKENQHKATSWEITDSSLQILNFSLNNKENLLIEGERLHGQGCRVQLNKHTVFCRQLSFDDAHFSGKTTPFLLGDKQGSFDDSRRFSFNNLSINKSTMLVPLWQTDDDEPGPLIKLSDLKLSLTGMEQEQQGVNNLSIQAAVGKQGNVELAGHMQRNGQGVVQFSATDINITSLTPLFSSWLALPIHKGSLHLEGRLKLPDNQFIGSFQLNDFTAKRKEGPAVHWQHAIATGVMARQTPFSVAIEEFSLLQPTIQLSPEGPTLPSGFLEFFKKKNSSASLPPVKIERCTISNGSLQRPPASATDQQLTEFSQLEATFTPLQPATQSSFNLSGRMGVTDFTITGHTGLTSSDTDELEVNHFPLAPFTQLFSQSLKIDTQKGVADWYLRQSSPDSGWVQLSGLSPMPDSDLSMTLALLTDKNDSFRLAVPSDATGAPALLLEQAVIEQLRQLRLQAVISNRLVLDKFLPELNLPKDVEFIPAETVPDFMEGLDDYTTLLELRPHLGLIIRGNFDKNTDGQHLRQVLQEAEDAQRELENLRREQLKATLLIEEEKKLANLITKGLPVNEEKLQQIEQRPDLQPLQRKIVEVPVNTLQDLARQRAEVTRSYFTDQLKIPPYRIEIQQGIPGGTKAELILKPLW